MTRKASGPDRGYDLALDLGAPAFRQYMLARADGRLIEAYDHLRRAAVAGSPLCMSALGSALICGEVPGLGPDPGAVCWIEDALRASGGSSGAADLGMLLLEGEYLPRDVPRGLALLAQAYENGHDSMAVTLARIHREGRHGLPCDERRAIEWALRAAPWWRRLLARIGISQVRWMDGWIGRLTAAERIFSEMAPREKDRMGRSFVSELRQRPQPGSGSQ